MKFLDVKAKLKPLQITITKKYTGEYRVNSEKGTEAQAYYTDDLMDAYHTGISMHKERIKSN